MHLKPHTHAPKRRRQQESAKHEAATPVADAASREDRLREAAYALYLKRGGQPGGALEDWLAAEAMLDAQGRH